MRAKPFLILLLACGPVVDAQATLQVPSQYATIQSAIDAAAAMDQILVAPGVYFERIDFLGKAITVRAPSGPTGTTVDATLTGTAVTFAGGEGPLSVLDGFTVSGGLATSGGGVRCVGTSPTLVGCVIANNAAALSGGGLELTGGAAPTLIGCTIRDNTARNGGGLRLLDSSPVMESCQILDNLATATGTASLSIGGGGMSCEGSSAPELTQCVFVGNNVLARITATGPQTNIVIDARGGAIACQDTSAPQLVSCALIDNEARAERTGGGETSWSRNTAATGGGLAARHHSAPILTWCSFEANRTTAVNITTSTSESRATGGAVGAEETTYVRLVNLLFWANQASATGADTDISRGGALYVRDNANLIVTQCTQSANDGGQAGGGLYVEGAGSATVGNTILWANLPDQVVATGTGPVRLDYCDVQGGWSGTGIQNISGDPAFVNPGSADWHLLSSSPCIDSGNGLIAGLPGTDLDGDARILGLDVDIGADEFVPVTPPLAGSGEDFILETWVNGAGPPTANGKLALPNDILTVRFRSPGGTFVGSTPLMGAELYATAGPGPGNFPGIPEIHMDPWAVVFIFPAFVAPLPGWTPILGPLGVTLDFLIPPGGSGFSIRFQAITISPLAANGVLAITDALDIVLL